MTIPSIAHDLSVEDHPNLRTIYGTLTNATNEIATFWPDESVVGKYSIEIVQGSDVKVHFQKNGEQNCEQTLRFGIDALHQGMGEKLRELGLDFEHIAMQFLGHETFHLSQAQRLLACGGKIEWINSGFAQGLQPTMNEYWKQVALALAERYPERRSMLPPIAQAADIVSELRADIRGLNALKRAKVNWRSFSKCLLSIREEEAKSNPDSYQISGAMNALTKNSLPLESRSLSKLWGISLAQMASMHHGSEIDAKIQLALSNLDLTLPPTRKKNPKTSA